MLAAFEGDLEEVKRLDKEDPDELTRTDLDMDGYLPIHCAVIGGELETVKWMVERDATLLTAQVSHGESCLHLAAWEGELEIAKWLVAKDRSLLYLQNSHRIPPIHSSAEWSFRVFEYLISEDPTQLEITGDFYEDFPIHWACYGGNLQVVQWILQQDPQMMWKKTSQGELPIHYAIIPEETAVLEYLIKLNPSLLQAQDNEGNTPLKKAFLLSKKEHISVIER